MTRDTLRLRCFALVAAFSFGPGIPYAAACNFPTMDVLSTTLPKITLRKTNEGTSKDEAKPASFGYENPNAGDDYLLVDAAMRWEALGCAYGGAQFVLLPAAEVHRSKFDANLVKKTSVKLEMEFAWGLLRSNDSAGDDAEGGHDWLPYFKAEYGETHDSIKGKNSSKAALAMHFASTLPFRPNGWVPWDCDVQPGENGEVAGACPDKFRWFPSVGIEYYDSLPVERTGLPTIASINSTIGVARLGIEFWPVLVGYKTAAPYSPLQILVEYTYRPRVGGDRLPGGDPTLLTIGLTYYVDAAQAIGVGIEHEDGQSPLRNFEDEERTTLSLRVKF